MPRRVVHCVLLSVKKQRDVKWLKGKSAHSAVKERAATIKAANVIQKNTKYLSVKNNNL
tara:strand:- start:362 stop:538 length:177 start_codon:yes stop_codon:yes gene_type:complete